jgi:outer membrane autotransporter protein
MRSVASAALAAALGLAAAGAHAQDAQWVGGNAGNPNEWTEPLNWTPNTVPGGTATFTSTASTTTVANDNGVVIVGAVQFTAAPNALAYTINITNSFIVNGAGVDNASTNTQTFTIDATNQPALVFQNASTANSGTGTVIYNNGFLVPGINPGDPPTNTGSVINFLNTSNAGSATTTFNNHGIFQFFDTSNGGSATINNDVQVDFFDSTSAGNATIVNAFSNTGAFPFTSTITFNNTATAGSAHINNQTNGGNVGDIEFNGSSTAGSAIITNSGLINFNNTSTAGSSQITNNSGGTITFHDASTAGSTVIGNNGTVAFVDSSSAGSAGITTTAAVSFSNTSTAATSNIAVNTGGSLAFNDTATAGSATITTSISSATITFNNSSSAGSANITNDSTAVSGLTFNNSSTAGSATIQNNGTTNFNDSSTAGTAHITNSSFLIFNNSADAGSATITNNSALIFNNSASANAANITSNASLNFHNSSTAGSASITLQNGGSAVFTDTSSGGTAAFTVAVGSAVDISPLTNGGTTAGSIAGAGNFFLGANTLTVGSLNTSTTVSGVIHDGGLGGGVGGALDKVGTGTLTLSNTNTYTGATTVDGGTLSVTGSIALSSGVAINSGATLDGTGIVSAIQVNSGGILMPGLPSAVGTLQATSVTFASGATYQITISGATNSKVTATGAATLNSGASVTISSGSTINVNQTYTILTAAGGVSGQFNPNVTFGAFTGTLTYDANDVFLTFALNSLSPLLPPGAPTNVVNVANAIDNFIAGGGTLPPGFQNLGTLSPGQLQGALTQLSGEVGTGAQLSGFQLMNQFMSLMLDPLAGGHGFGVGPLPFASEQPQTTFTPEVANAYASVLKAPAAPITAYGPWRAWGAAYGGSNSVTGDPVVVGSHDVRTTAGGFAAGLDYRATPNTVLGFALAGAATGWNLSAGLGSGQSDAFQAGLYAKQQFGQAYLSGALAFANYWASTSRVVTVAGADTLKASFDAQSYGGRLEGGYRLSLTPVTLTPYAAVQAQSFRLPGYGETAASGSPQFALAYAGQTSTATRAELGSWLSHTALLAGGDTAVLFGRLAWAHDWFSNLAVTPSFQALPGASFVVNGAAPPHDLALVTAGAEWRMRSNWSVMARFDGEFGDGQQTYTGTARLRYAW